jgi:hypothetical protein
VRAVSVRQFDLCTLTPFRHSPDPFRHSPIDPSKKPKTIDYEMSDGLTKGKKQFGIYEVDAVTFKSCFSKPDAERPADFTSTAGDGRTLSVWKLEKPAVQDTAQPDSGPDSVMG